MDHIAFLTIALSALIIGSLPKLKFLSTLAIGLLVADFIIHFNDINEHTILHFSVDLLAVSVLAAFSQIINKDWIKILYIPLAIFILLALHPYNKNVKKHVQETETNAFEDLEILAQLDPQIDIQNWVKDNQKKFDIIYPLFNPKDKSGLLDEYIGINVKSNQDFQSVLDQLNDDPSIVYFENNEELELKLPKQEKRIGSASQQKVNDPLSQNQWAIDKLEMDRLHQLLKSNDEASNTTTQTVIAILDTGIEANHEDLKENYLSTNTSYDKDVRGHGTHCAGIAAAVTGNNIGIASLLLPQSQIKVTSIKVLSNFGIGAQHQIIAGIIEASDKGVDVISMSLGAPSTPGKEDAYNQAVSYARQQGAIVVVSAGNSNEDAGRYSPANTKGVITVASVDKNFVKSPFSNTVNNVPMGISAPGQDIYSTMSGNTYTYMSGTSMASPFVAGLIALIKSIDPNISTEEVYDILKKSATQKGNLEIINPVEALKEMLE